jgi:hypothetical protein
MILPLIGLSVYGLPGGRLYPSNRKAQGRAMDIEKLKEHAARCRRLANMLTDERAIVVLREMAAECEALLTNSQVAAAAKDRVRPILDER